MRTGAAVVRLAPIICVRQSNLPWALVYGKEGLRYTVPMAPWGQADDSSEGSEPSRHTNVATEFPIRTAVAFCPLNRMLNRCPSPRPLRTKSTSFPSGVLKATSGKAATAGDAERSLHFQVGNYVFSINLIVFSFQ
jgi:hypothetical protein